jgi:hypothetical protein
VSKRNCESVHCHARSCNCSIYNIRLVPWRRYPSREIFALGRIERMLVRSAHESQRSSESKHLERAAFTAVSQAPIAGPLFVPGTAFSLEVFLLSPSSCRKHISQYSGQTECHEQDCHNGCTDRYAACLLGFAVAKTLNATPKDRNQESSSLLGKYVHRLHLDYFANLHVILNNRTLPRYGSQGNCQALTSLAFMANRGRHSTYVI